MQFSDASHLQWLELVTESPALSALVPECALTFFEETETSAPISCRLRQTTVLSLLAIERN